MSKRLSAKQWLIVVEAYLTALFPLIFYLLLGSMRSAGIATYWRWGSFDTIILLEYLLVLPVVKLIYFHRADRTVGDAPDNSINEKGLANISRSVPFVNSQNDLNNSFALLFFSNVVLLPVSFVVLLVMLVWIEVKHFKKKRSDDN